LVTGDIAFLPAPAPLLVFTRGVGAEGFTLVFNLGVEPAHWAGGLDAVYVMGATRTLDGWDVPLGCGVILNGQ
jgi:hypothetical protein